MIEIPTRADQTLAVFGLGASGIATVEALRLSGATVAAWDDDGNARRAAEGIGLTDLYASDWSSFDGLVLSPGVPLTHPEPHPVVRRAHDAGIAVLGDIELLCEACPEAAFIGITGTNGKSTTTALVHHVLGASGRPVEVGGNLGPPALSLERLGDGGIYVVELSSYQLDLTHRAAFDVAVLLNISPDHLDRHGDMTGYIAAKSRIFRDRPAGGQTAVIGIDDEASWRFVDAITARGDWRVIPISSRERVDDGVYALDGQLHDAIDAIDGAGGDMVCDLSTVDSLPGPHNWQNAAAAYAAARTVGMAAADIAGRLKTYPGLPHRQETVARLDGVRYVNDSKATNPDAAARALACYGAVYWIAGGRAKDGGLGPVLSHTGRIRHAYLIGEAADGFAAALDGTVPLTRCRDLAAALRAAHDRAHAEARPDATVLLSPACASFDQFADFAARGDAFRAMVQDLAAEAVR